MQRPLHMPAVVADHMFATLVVGECDVAFGASRHCAALEAVQERGIAAAVLE